MKQSHPQSRHNMFWTVILCYLIPFIGLSSYGAWMTHAKKSWDLLSIGLFLTAIGTLLLYWILARFESSWKRALVLPQSPLSDPHFSQTSDLDETCAIETADSSSAELAIAADLANSEQALQEASQINEQLKGDLEAVIDELQRISKENEDKEEHLQKTLSELDACGHSFQLSQEQYKVYIEELQDQLSEQKFLMEKKQVQISHLETKVSDLTYEIKTLLQIAERHTEPQLPSSSEEEFTSEQPRKSAKKTDDINSPTGATETFVYASQKASMQLKRCLDIAQKITGSNRFSSQISSFLDSPADSFTLDLRRLCDTLRIENNCTIVLYSPKENQPLFANNQIRELTGWSPEKFVQNFNDILEKSMHEWKQNLSGLAFKPETSVKLSLKTKEGEQITVNGHLGLISTGIFRHHAIAILYP